MSREYDDLCSLEGQCQRELKALPGKQEERRVLREEWLKKEKEKKEKQAEEEIKEVRKKIEEQEKKMRYGNNVAAGNVDRARKYIREQSAQVYAEILMLRKREFLRGGIYLQTSWFCRSTNCLRDCSSRRTHPHSRYS